MGVVALPVVTDTLVSPALVPITNARVEIRLFLNGTDGQVYLASSEIFPKVTLRPDSNGLISVTLPANSTLTPSGSYYQAEISIPGETTRTETFIVPNTAGPFLLGSILSVTPAAGIPFISTALPLPLAATALAGTTSSVSDAGHVHPWTGLATDAELATAVAAALASLAYHPATYGAVADGVTDDTAALNAALAAMPATGGVLDLGDASHVYAVTSDLLIRKPGTRLIGHGAVLKVKTTWTTPAQSGTVAAMVTIAYSADSSVHTPVTDVEIAGVTFRGLRDVAQASEQKAITAYYSQTVNIHDCHFEDFGHEVIWPPNQANNSGWNIHHNTFTRTGYSGVTAGAPCAVQMNCTDSACSNNIFTDNYLPIGVSGNNNTVSGNTIRDVIYAGISCGDGVGQGLNVTIHGNTIVSDGSTWASTTGINVTNQGKGVTLSGNTIRLRAVAGSIDMAGIKFSGSRDGQVCADNTVIMDMNGQAVVMEGILVVGTGAQVSISDNEIVFLNEASVYHAGILASAGNGVTLRTVVSHNEVYGATQGNTGYAIDLNQTGSGVHTLVATHNVSDGGYHRYAGVLYPGLDNVPVSYSATAGLSTGILALGTLATQAALGNHAHSGVYDPAGTAASAVATHAGLADPHPTYLNQTEGDARYGQLGALNTWALAQTFTGQVLLADGSAATPSVAFATATGLGMYRRASSIIGWTASSSEMMSLTSTSILSLRATGSYGWSQTSDPSAGQDVSLFRNGAGILAQRVGTNVQEFQLHERYTSGADYARLALRTAAGDYLLSPEAATQTLRGLQLVASGGRLGFYGTAAVAKQTVTGSRGANAALADLLTKLATLGLIADGSS